MSFYYTEMLELQTNLRANVVSVRITITEKNMSFENENLF